MLVACDIGGVVKQMTTENSIDNAIESIKFIEKNGHKVVFVSKCKKQYQILLKQWLIDNDLGTNEVFFCEEYSEKNAICKKLKVEIMIDDKLQVFRDMPDSILKIWFCSDSKKINGAKLYQSDEYVKVSTCPSWEEIVVALQI